MDQQRRQYASTIKSEINMIENIIKKNRDLLLKLPNSKLSKQIIEEKIDQIETETEQKEKELEQLQKRLENCLSGLLDVEIYSQMKKDTEQNTVKKNVVRKKFDDLVTEKTKNKSMLESERQKQNSENRESRNHENTLLYVNRVLSTTPDYILDKLKDKPHNRGIIFRGVWYFGEKPAKPNEPLIMEIMENKIKYYQVYNYHEVVCHYFDANKNKVIAWRKPRNTHLRQYDLQ